MFFQPPVEGGTKGDDITRFSFMRILNQQDNFNENYFYAKYARKKLNQ
jgi:hypothetical protein